MMPNATSAEPSVQRDELANRLAIAVGRINRRIRPSGPALSYGQLSALSSIVRLGPMRPGDLARLESISASSATRVLAGLESQGFVTRTPDPLDGRASFIEASVPGAQAVLMARAERATLLTGLLADCDADDIHRLAAALDVLEAVGRVHADQPAD